MEATIHSTSIIDPTCELSEGVEIGPYCIIGPDVQIGERTKLISNVTILSSTKVGKRCTIYPYTTLGGPSQVQNLDMKKAALVIGDDCVIRESTTIHLSSKGQDQPTRIGNRNFIMAHSHIGHDSILHDDVTIVTGVGLAGHTEIEKGAIIGGMAGVHQFCRIGEYAFVGAGTKVSYFTFFFRLTQKLMVLNR
jgi:UDP-N-acetylglucosamine acyltransferase